MQLFKIRYTKIAIYHLFWFTLISSVATLNVKITVNVKKKYIKG